jgi:hypothetical protein
VPRSAAAIPEASIMKLDPARCRFCVTFGFVLLVAMMTAPVVAAEAFPYDRQLMLDVAPMGKVRRVPSVTISDDGTARIELWCKTAMAQVALNTNAIQIVPAPLADALPQYMSDGQCSPERIAADLDLLNALSQVTSWQAAGGVVTLSGQSVLRFRPSDH